MNSIVVRDALSPRLSHRAVMALAVVASGCDHEILVGADLPPDASPEAGVGVLAVPWSTGFENGLAGWELCYATGGGTNPTIVTSPVHSGQHAAAFTLTTGVWPEDSTRCVRQGVLPKSAYYGAWYYVPALATNRGNWNLLHFRGGNAPDASTHGLWDVSLVNDPNGGLDPSVRDFLRMQRVLDAGPAIPIGQWFHLEIHLRRANDGTGQFTLYRDGQVVLDLNGLTTDDTQFGGWHVGNLATALSPTMSTVYVDDVTIDPRSP
jgi:hypothetical protein